MTKKSKVVASFRGFDPDVPAKVILPPCLSFLSLLLPRVVRGGASKDDKYYEAVSGDLKIAVGYVESHGQVTIGWWEATIQPHLHFTGNCFRTTGRSPEEAISRLEKECLLFHGTMLHLLKHKMGTLSIEKERKSRKSEEE